VLQKLHSLWLDQKQPLLAASSTIGTVAAVYYRWRSPVAIASSVVLIAHEYGHYFAAKDAGADVMLPFFIPIGAFTIGFTSIKNLKKDKDIVAAAGPIVGTIVALIISGVVLIFFHHLGVWKFIALAAMEIVNGVLLTDGMRYRQARREL
jgi:hypothetical protein